MNYGVTVCVLCNQTMSFQQVREAVYWLPDMDAYELSWARYEGFVHKFAHRKCWKRQKEKRREMIRLVSFKGQEPQSMGQKV